MMSNERAISKTYRKKRKQENSIKVDPAILENLINTHIILLTKSSSKFPKAKFVCKICPYHMDDVDRALKHSNDNLHKRNLQKLCIRNLLTYLPYPPKTQIEVINESLEKTLKEQHFISKVEYQRRLEICVKMNELACENYPGIRLVIYGSLLTGLSLKSSSDVNLFLDTQTINRRQTSYLFELERLNKIFKSNMSLKNEIKLDKNNSGLFCKDKHGVVYHITANSRNQHFTSELIRLYLKIDIRAEQLSKIFRYFAHISFIDQVQDGFFPSQVFSLLVIFYLQQLPIPILPNLHKLAESRPDLPESSLTHVTITDSVMTYVSDLTTIHKLWTPPVNVATLADLWIGLLKFYVIDFNSSTHMVSIVSSLPVLKFDRHMVNKRLAIEDPFDMKRNMLFSWNSPDVVDFLNDQLQSCYSYFAVPQLSTGPFFHKVRFYQTSLSNLNRMASVTPIFSSGEYQSTLDELEAGFRLIFGEQSTTYDVTRWPVDMLIKSCLKPILSAVFNSSNDIDKILVLLELKVRQSMCYSIDGYGRFRDIAMRLARSVLDEFSQHFDRTDSWNHKELDCQMGYDIVKRAAQKFINESLNLSGNEDEDDDDEDELPDTDMNELDDPLGDREFVMDEVEEIDASTDMQSTDDKEDSAASMTPEKDVSKCLLIQIPESWKLPIIFQKILVPVKGAAVSSDEPDEYNADRVSLIDKADLVYTFSRIPMHDKKLVITCPLCNTKGHRKENCVYAVPRFDELQGTMETLDRAWLAKLKVVLTEKSKSVTQTAEKMKQSEKIFEKIVETIKALYPTAQPQLFGSTINGFITKTSDLDICLEFFEGVSRLGGDNSADKPQQLSNKELTSRLRVIGREIKKIANMVRVDYILRAKVPIVKFHLRNNVQGDISINNSLGVQNTKMLKLYAEIAGGVKPLGNLIKFVAKSCEIGDASQGTLSSYAYMLMLIHFLQRRGVLPVLQELYEGTRPTVMIDGWDAWYQSNLTTIHKLWSKKVCNTQLEYLWLDFFYYYAVEFDLDKQVITIKQSEPLYKIDKNWQTAYMAVEDPFNLSHNLCGSLSLENCRYILECFAHVLRLHSNSDNLARPDSAHMLLFEPATLKPQATNARSCFNCNQSGHIARDCTDRAAKRTPTKQSSLPVLTAPLQFKQSNIPSRVYLQSGDVADGQQCPSVIPLKSFKADINMYSVVPLSMKFGDHTVIVPLLVGKNEVVEKKLNLLFKNGVSGNTYDFPAPLSEPTKQSSVNDRQHGGSTQRQYDEFQRDSPISAFRRQPVPMLKQSPIAGNYNSSPQKWTPMLSGHQPFPRAQVQMANQPRSSPYDTQIRMISNSSLGGIPFMRFGPGEYGAVPPGYQPPSNHMYQNQQHQQHQQQHQQWYGSSHMANNSGRGGGHHRN